MDSLMHVSVMFMGSGAGHLTGKDGVYKMLRIKGYSVRPVEPGTRDGKAKDELAELNFNST
jgi:hypothetical protein